MLLPEMLQGQLDTAYDACTQADKAVQELQRIVEQGGASAALEEEIIVIQLDLLFRQVTVSLGLSLSLSRPHPLSFFLSLSPSHSLAPALPLSLTRALFLSRARGARARPFYFLCASQLEVSTAQRDGAEDRTAAFALLDRARGIMAKNKTQAGASNAKLSRLMPRKFGTLLLLLRKSVMQIMRKTH